MLLAVLFVIWATLCPQCVLPPTLSQPSLQLPGLRNPRNAFQSQPYGRSLDSYSFLLRIWNVGAESAATRDVEVRCATVGLPVVAAVARIRTIRLLWSINDVMNCQSVGDDPIVSSPTSLHKIVLAAEPSAPQPSASVPNSLVYVKRYLTEAGTATAPRNFTQLCRYDHQPQAPYRTLQEVLLECSESLSMLVLTLIMAYAGLGRSPQNRLVSATLTWFMIPLASAQYVALGIGSSALHSCATTALGGLRCWGYNLEGQTGVCDRDCVYVIVFVCDYNFVCVSVRVCACVFVRVIVSEFVRAARARVCV